MHVPLDRLSDAPGWPGSPARWAGSAKSGVGTALSASPVWYTLSHGIVNEIFAPRIDQAMTRDLGFLVTGAGGFVSESKRDARHETICPVAGVPYHSTTSRCTRGRYRLQCDVLTDPSRLVVLMRLRFSALIGTSTDYRWYALLAPHLGNQGAGNTAWLGDYKGVDALFAARDVHALCLMSSDGFAARSVGFVGVSDGWQDLMAHGELTWRHQRADNGNVALTGELPDPAGEVTLALGFGRNADEAATAARGALLQGFASIQQAYVKPWQAWLAGLLPWARDGLAAISMGVLKTHESKQIPGALLASLAIPWGASRGDGDLGGYHLIWPRDMVESAGGLLAAGAHCEARAALLYLASVQEHDGHWAQNLWLDGRPYWSGVQMDETALPILLLDLLFREGALESADLSDARFWPMVRNAAAYLVQNGPATPQDRWEENAGYTPFSLGATVAALLVAAEWAGRSGAPELAPFLRETADSWQAQLDHWLYVEDTPLARRVGVRGYYVRVAEEQVGTATRYVIIRNRDLAEALLPASEVVSTDALALVRFGLRAADDPRIRDTVRVIDATLKVQTLRGDCWRRYTNDGYGENEDGSPFDGTGIGRLWPLLTGERAHYALANGQTDQADALRAALEQFAGDGGLFPEQVWDGADRPEHELALGRPTGSAMPLAWAHAEYMKLLRSLRDGRVFDMPPQTVERYQRSAVGSDLRTWRFEGQIGSVPDGSTLRIMSRTAARIHWSADGWRTTNDSDTTDSGLGVHYADLPTIRLAAGTQILFTFYWPDSQRWEGRDFGVVILPGG